MEKVYFSHITAFNCIKELRSSPAYNDSYDKYDLNVNRISFPDKVVSSYSFVRYLDGLNAFAKENLPFDILLPTINAKYKTPNLNFHVCTAKLPKNAFIKFNDQVAIAGPELTFIQLAEVLSFEQLVIAGLELCGTYVVAQDWGIDFTSAEKGFIDQCLPATSVEKIKHTIALLKRNKSSGYIRGINKAIDALECVGNLSASPRESMIFAMLSGPRKHGMYGILGLTMNTEVELSYEASQIAGQDRAKIDICSLKNKVAIEYDSRMFHEGVAPGQHDKRRSTGLLYDGWKVISIVPEQVHDIIAFDNLARVILGAMGMSKKNKSKKFNDNFHSTFTAFRDMDMQNFTH
ncbi:MAG: hypothetical protein Q4E88_01855 [Coriobacteriia bacterium]|nr:hypothetical protein [Coriobacteriia bacterium]